jgi:uncharacterized protein YjbJ (UPF0337 family)
VLESYGSSSPSFLQLTDERPLINAAKSAAQVHFFNQTSKGKRMNWEQIQGHWKQVTGQAREQWGKLTNDEQWGKLTDDEFYAVTGRCDQLSGKIQERHGVAQEEAEKQATACGRAATDSLFTSDKSK